VPRDLEDAAIVRVGDRVDLADAPGLAHVGTAGQHAAVEIGLDADDAQHRVWFGQRAVGDLADVLLDGLHRAAGAQALRDGHAQRAGVLVEELLVAADDFLAGVAVADGGQADGVVVLQEREQALEAVVVGGLPAAGLALDVAGAATEDAGRLASLRVFLG